MLCFSENNGGRIKRQRKDKGSRLSALQKLKELKGQKHKAEIGDIENVYEEVEEKEYFKRVQERQSEDFIDDDGKPIFLLYFSVF